MKTALARRRRGILLAACAAGLALSTSACHANRLVCTVHTVQDAPAGQGR